MSTTTRFAFPTRAAVSLAALLLLSANLRPALTSVGPLIEDIRQAAGLSPSAAGLLSSLPLVAFGLFAPLGQLGRRLGLERTLVGALLLLVAGLLLRSQGSGVALFAGSLVLAAGIAIGNVLAPIVIKRDFPQRVSATMLYAATMGLAAAAGSGLAVPLAHTLPGGWRAALGVWVLPALAALAVWGAAARGTNGTPVGSVPTHAPLWRSGLAWQVTAFMGLQSLAFYTAVAWFPKVLQDQGRTPGESGWLITLYQIVTLAASVAVPALLRRLRDQRLPALAASLLQALGTVGLLLVPAWAYLWVLLMGLGGVSVLLALRFIDLRAATHHEAVSLSVMAQSWGYLLAAAGPWAVGLLHERSGSWTAPLMLLTLLALVQAWVGLGAGRNRTVGS